MAMRRGSRRRKAGMSAGLLGIASLIVAVLSMLQVEDSKPAANTMAVAVGLVTLTTAAVALVRWGLRVEVPAAARPEKIAQAKGALAGLVRDQWDAEALIRALDDPDPIPVRWRLTARQLVMDRPANLPVATLTASSDDIAALVTEFRQMRRRRLVILGGPGTGKTTLAVQLVRQLLDTRTEHENEPVPVLLSVAGWDTERFPRLHDWLATRLASDYPALRAAEFGSDAPAALAQGGHILPVLDGLDELPPPAQAAMINALNRSLSGNDRLVLTCRTTEYEHAVQHAGDVLASAVVIEPDPLDPTTAADYLNRSLPLPTQASWEPVLNALRGTGSPAGPTEALAEIAATPLGLWLIRVAYCNTYGDPAPLLDTDRFPNAAALRAHLFNLLIPALIRTRRPSGNPADLFCPRRRHDPERIRQWLSFVAWHLTTQGTRDLAWWHLAATTQALTLATRLTIGALTTLTFTLTLWLPVGLTFGLPSGLPFVLTFGLPAGTAVALASGSWAHEDPGFANLQLHDRVPLLLRKLAVGLPVGLAVAVAVAVMFKIVSVLTEAVLSPWVGPVLGLGLTLGLASGFVSWAEAPTPGEQQSTPLASWQADRTLNLLRLNAFAFMLALVFVRPDRSVPGLMYALVYAPVFGLPAWLTFGRRRAWLAYQVATWRLATAGRTPRKLMPFLDDAHRLGLLRAVGPIYQFRHAELQDQLTADYAHRYRRQVLRTAVRTEPRRRAGR